MDSTKNNYCQHCWPTKRRYHFDQHINYYIQKIAKPLNIFNQLSLIVHYHLWGGILAILHMTKLVKFDDYPNRELLFNRSLIFLDEAKKRKLQVHTIKVLGKYVHDFRLTYKGKKYYFTGIPTTIWRNRINLDNKYQIKRTLKANKIPVSEGQVFTNTNLALSFAEKLRYPLVVKPNDGSLSHHVTYPINNKQELLHAIKIAKQYSPLFIVEKFISGSFYRATVVGKKYVFICQKDPANIIGDGKSMIKQLIQEKNNHKYRGGQTQKNTTLHKIIIDNVLANNLVEQSLNLKSVPKKGKKIYLHKKYILALGCDIINYTKQAHMDNKKLFLEIAKILDSDLIGIDFLAPDITKSYKKQITGVIETNSLPYIDMHQFPSQGKGDNVAKVVWDYVLNKIESTS